MLLSGDRDRYRRNDGERSRDVWALPISVAMHAAVGDSGWFSDSKRTEALVEGFAQACIEAGAVWGGGETPTLGGVVEPEAIVLAGSAIGKISPKQLRITGDVS